MEQDFSKYIGQSVQFAKKSLEDNGFLVVVKKNSLMKIQSDYELVVKVNLLNSKEVELVVGDFLINIENV